MNTALVSVSLYQEGKFEFNRIMEAFKRNIWSHHGRCVVAGTTGTMTTNYIMHVLMYKACSVCERALVLVLS